MICKKRNILRRKNSLNQFGIHSYPHRLTHDDDMKKMKMESKMRNGAHTRNEEKKNNFPFHIKMQSLFVVCFIASIFLLFLRQVPHQEKIRKFIAKNKFVNTSN